MAEHAHTTAKRRAKRSVATAEQAATLDFQAMDREVMDALPTKGSYMEAAAATYVILQVGVAMLTKSPAELATGFAKTGERDETVLGVWEELKQARDLLHGYVETLDCVIARVVIVASKIAVGTQP